MSRKVSIQYSQTIHILLANVQDFKTIILVDGGSTAVDYVTLAMLYPLLSHFSSFSSGTFSRELGVTQPVARDSPSTSLIMFFIIIIFGPLQQQHDYQCC